ncbi:hypothetical protein PSHT_13620 [Puccinia striiformis]|uniref:Uncharacterized protein n=1 Tax=Puccinia striiformis TaxID=27350 RepID=A0A2S4UPG8_9BASI|nr:hypothetical protein PSHT_13620 [Puccinia striiformis]
MSKAEGRAIQEKQRADKAVLKGSPAVSASPKQPTGKALNNPPTAARPPGIGFAGRPDKETGCPNPNSIRGWVLPGRVGLGFLGSEAARTQPPTRRV